MAGQPALAVWVFVLKEKEDEWINIRDWGADIDVDNFLTFTSVLMDVIKEDKDGLAQLMESHNIKIELLKDAPPSWKKKPDKSRSSLPISNLNPFLHQRCCILYIFILFTMSESAPVVYISLKYSSFSFYLFASQFDV